MAIKRLPASTATDIQLSIDNGDLRALEEIQAKWNFKDKESALRFALAILITAKTKTIKVTNEIGVDVSLTPSDSLLASKPEDKAGA